jgi:DNA-binding transcriptional MerR regulator
VSETYTITELAEEFQVTSRTIRFYEDKELLRPKRNGLNRVYSRRDRARLVLILRGKRLGFRLDDIKELLDLYDFDEGHVEQLRATLGKSRERIEVLELQRRDVDQVLKELREACGAIETKLKDKGVNAGEV